MKAKCEAAVLIALLMAPSVVLGVPVAQIGDLIPVQGYGGEIIPLLEVDLTARESVVGEIYNDVVLGSADVVNISEREIARGLVNGEADEVIYPVFISTASGVVNSISNINQTDTFIVQV